LLAKNQTHVIEPRSGLAGVTELDLWRAIEIEALNTVALNNAALGIELIGDEHRLTWRPGRLLNGAIVGDPLRRRYGDDLSVLVALRLPTCIEPRDAREPAVDVRAGPQLAAGHEEERVGLRHVGAEVAEFHAVGARGRWRRGRG